jgi:basic membrane protein A
MIEDLKAGTYGTKSYSISLAGNSVKLLRTPQVPDDIWSEIMALREEIVSGSMSLTPVFDAGEVRALVTLTE